jgi:hypothetical protein
VIQLVRITTPTELLGQLRPRSAIVGVTPDLPPGLSVGAACGLLSRVAAVCKNRRRLCVRRLFAHYLLL